MLLPIICQIFLYLISYTVAQPIFKSRVCQDTFGNYTPNSAFKKNLDTLFSTMLSDTKIDYGFYNMSVGKNLDTVHGIGLCKPDISAAACRRCLRNGAQAIVVACPYQRDGIGWYEECMIRYSDRYIFGKKEFGPWYFLRDRPLAEVDPRKFNHTASTLLAKLKVKAASGDYHRKFGAGEAKVTNSFTIYALVQCTPDLEFSDCYQCLDYAISYSLTDNYGLQARIFFTSCNIRYENYPFYDSSSLRLLDIPPPPPPKSASRPHLPIVTTKAGNAVRNPESLQMNFETIRAATDNFSIANKLGQGGFGAVYKGRLPDGQAIAVKRLSKVSGQGEAEFKNEAALVARLQHRNLVKFLGFCLEREERLLIYELLANRSLDHFLFDPIKRVELDWATRFKIIGGIARGLLYLHEDSRLLVVHRDLKSGNILLDGEMHPKISDFGMARLFGVDQTQGDTSKICGTYGYMPPEYVQQGHFSFKSDVFGFGVLLLEIITGQKINSYYNAKTGETLLCFAWRNWLEGTPLSITDTTMPAVNTAQVLRCINIGLLCVQENIAHRPIMSFVVLMLNSHTTTPLVPSRPAWLLDKDVNLDHSKAPISTINEVSISELDPR